MAVVVAGLVVLGGGPGGAVRFLEDLVDVPGTVAEPVDLEVTPVRARRASRWLEDLEVTPRASGGDGYDRELFEHWIDEDDDGQDTREEVLDRDLPDGRLDPGPYTGRVVTLDPEDPTSVHIDHVRALGDAWDSGASSWGPARRRTFANDQTNLLAVDGAANMVKGDSPPGEWRPANRGAWCVYAVIYVETSHRYDLSIDAPDRSALTEMIEAC